MWSKADVVFVLAIFQTLWKYSLTQMPFDMNMPLDYDLLNEDLPKVKRGVRMYDYTRHYPWNYYPDLANNMEQVYDYEVDKFVFLMIPYKNYSRIIDEKNYQTFEDFIKQSMEEDKKHFIITSCMDMLNMKQCNQYFNEAVSELIGNDPLAEYFIEIYGIDDHDYEFLDDVGKPYKKYRQTKLTKFIDEL